MALNLPDPYQSGNGILQGLDTGSTLMQKYLQNKLNPYQMTLLQAQAQEAQANAAKGQMWAKLLNSAMGGDSSGGGGVANPELIAGLLKIPVYHTTVDGKVVTINPLSSMGGGSSSVSAPSSNGMNVPSMSPGQSYVVGSGQSPQNVPSEDTQNIPKADAIASSNAQNPEAIIPPGQSMPAPNFQGSPDQTQLLPSGMSVAKVGPSKLEEQANQAKQNAIGDWMKKNYTSQGADQSMQNIIDLARKGLSDPNYANVAGTLEGKFIDAQPLGVPVGSMLQSAYPNKFSKEDASALGNMKGYFGQIYQQAAANFKGPFKTMIKGVIDQYKPNVGDSIATQQAKLAAMEAITQSGIQYKNRVNALVNQGADPITAGALVDRQFNINSIKKQVDDSYNSELKKVNQNGNSSNSNADAMVKVLLPDGKTRMKMSYENAQQLVKDHPDHKILG